MTETLANADLRALIADVPDHPKPGVVFKDITPLLASPRGYAACVDALVAAAPSGIDAVCGMEARGFLFGAPVALALGAAFVPVRKPGKLPRAVVETSFELEYSSETLAVHADAIAPGARVLIVDDVLATGGTVVATAELVRRLGGELAGVAVVMELAFLQPRALLSRHGVDDVAALLTYED
ncbi:adenine phosphoribosyltransferase [Litorihabitans aurantiacus]|uniref:Adenine phosphoribosyltransferase n=1 Tax=Litorihabitans aurantiacus TaxID=1930061 RepID=A0AA38CRB0_9MICO|nr:adenine phosphoribosyltransferase [Litorihabitans aurantiacus]GMA32783.1 adenine phosphoribosyltransferase [Litorihabitans aurantiacus]